MNLKRIKDSITSFSVQFNQVEKGLSYIAMLDENVVSNYFKLDDGIDLNDKELLENLVVENIKTNYLRQYRNEDIKIEKLNVELNLNKKENKNKGIKMKRITRSEQILRELDFGRGMTTTILIDRIKELDKIIPGRKEGYLLIKGKEEMFYSDIFVENLLRKKFNKYLDDGKVVI
ncbi:hypothetical protein NSA42_03165 [Paeniclostridium sordellii]|uniref:hypothetical protein n=1 Tax=Paraclostridium sordellii TaxID=1505 RepID=UPI00214A6697|nr:hypothetical protein [Paeniclostridium sordellii]MCR1848269.1 hypothetical protein [Paeniclostridium sordellii]